jgi:hypothetical protein
MAAGLVMLLSPLARVGVDTGVFARRLALTLEAVPLTAERVAHAAGGTSHPARPGRLGRGGRGTGARYRDRRGRRAARGRVARVAASAGRDWLLLGGGIAACLLVGRL